MMRNMFIVLLLCALLVFSLTACKKKEPEPPAPQIPVPMMPSGQPPTGQMPIEQMPPAQMPPAQAPQRQMPPSQMPPTGQFPGPGMHMMGKTEVFVPESVKGKWSAARILFEDKGTKIKKEYEIKLHSDFAVPNTPLKIHVGEFLPDFKMDGLKLTSASNEPRNPALSIKVYENGKQIFPAPGREWGWLFGKVPSIHPFEHPKYGITLKEGVRKG